MRTFLKQSKHYHQHERDYGRTTTKIRQSWKCLKFVFKISLKHYVVFAFRIILPMSTRWLSFTFKLKLLQSANMLNILFVWYVTYSVHLYNKLNIKKSAWAIGMLVEHGQALNAKLSCSIYSYIISVSFI